MTTEKTRILIIRNGHLIADCETAFLACVYEKEGVHSVLACDCETHTAADGAVQCAGLCVQLNDMLHGKG